MVGVSVTTKAVFVGRGGIVTTVSVELCACDGEVTEGSAKSEVFGAVHACSKQAMMDARNIFKNTINPLKLAGIIFVLGKTFQVDCINYTSRDHSVIVLDRGC